MYTGRMVLSQKGIRRGIENACASMKCTVQQLFMNAFTHSFGKRRGVNREARSAAQRFIDKNSLSSRARKAIAMFIAGLGGGHTPAVATS